MPANAERHARDAYLLRLLGALRPPERGGVQVFTARTGAQGDPVRPSRLLLQVPRESLPSRVRHLFAPTRPVRRQHPWKAPWPLRVPAPDRVPAHLGVTAFRDYLSHPLAFHLRRGLGMREVEGNPSEMDAADAGSFFHSLMGELTRDAVRGAGLDGDSLGEWLQQALEVRFRDRYGEAPGVALLAQRVALRKRLRAAARVHADLNRRGWRTIATEFEIDGALEWMGVRITGRIDRVDQSEDGSLRVLDYKTSTAGIEPGRAHWTAHRGSTEGWPDWRLFERGGKTHRWNDLQLPLYVLAARVLHPGAPAIQAGYFLAPEEPGGTAVSLMDLTDADLSATRRCAEGILAELQTRRIAPPSPRADAREFERILFSGREGTVEVIP